MFVTVVGFVAINDIDYLFHVKEVQGTGNTRILVENMVDIELGQKRRGLPDRKLMKANIHVKQKMVNHKHNIDMQVKDYVYTEHKCKSI